MIRVDRITHFQIEVTNKTSHRKFKPKDFYLRFLDKMDFSINTKK